MFSRWLPYFCCCGLWPPKHESCLDDGEEEMKFTDAADAADAVVAVLQLTKQVEILREEASAARGQVLRRDQVIKEMEDKKHGVSPNRLRFDDRCWIGMDLSKPVTCVLCVTVTGRKENL